MIYTSYFSKIPDLVKVNIEPIIITSYYPPFIPERSLRHWDWLAPKWDAVAKHKHHDIGDEEYIEEYNKVLASIPTDKLSYLASYARVGQDIGLLCYESPNKFCHRHLLREWLNKQGIYSIEYGVEN